MNRSRFIAALLQRFLWLLTWIALVPIQASAFTLVPIPYSGQLTEAGVAINGTRFFTFTLYDAATGGTAVRAQSESLTVFNGVYHTTLFTLPSDWSGSRWLGVSVNSAPEMTPRIAIGTVPLSFHASQADTARWLTSDGFGSHTHSGLITIGTIAWTPIDSMTLVMPRAGTALVQATGSSDRFSGAAPNWSAQLLLTTNPTPVAGDLSFGGPQSAVVPYTVAKALSLAAGTYTLRLWLRISNVGDNVDIAPNLMYYLILPTPAP